ncbi:hypothetical protein [Saccharothrix xinjiangensis]
MRRTALWVAVVGVAAGMVFGTVGSAAADPGWVSADQCVTYGGLITPAEDEDGFVCNGGRFDGYRVYFD